MGPRQQPLHLPQGQGPKPLPCVLRSAWGLALMVGGPLGPAWAGGSGQNPDQASETLDSSPGSRPHIKANLRGASPQDKWKIREGEVSTGHRERRPAGDHSKEVPTRPWQPPSWGQEAGRALRPGQVDPERGYLSPGWPPPPPPSLHLGNPCQRLLNPFPAGQLQ